LNTNLKYNLAIVGAGNQALAWAQNLQDSNFSFSLGLRENSASFCLAKKFSTFELGPKLSNFNLIVLLIPDEEHLSFLNAYSSFIKKDSIIIYAHAYSLIKESLHKLYPNLDHILLAPKSIASEVRNNFLKSQPTPCVFSHASKEVEASLFEYISNELSLALGFSILSKVKLQDEVYADLFSEQTLLCGLYPYMMNLCYNILCDHGIDENLAFLEVFYESKLILNAISEVGPQDFFKKISPNALIGSHYAHSKIIDEDLKIKLESIFTDIINHEFFKISQESSLKEIQEETDVFWKNSSMQQKYSELKLKGLKL